MSTVRASSSIERGHAGCVFWVLWIAATLVGALVYFIPVGAVHFVLGLDQIDPERIGELGLSFLVFASVLCGAACARRSGWRMGRSRTSFGSADTLTVAESRRSTRSVFQERLSTGKDGKLCDWANSADIRGRI